ncbi:putative porin [Formosa sp. PL04]|uniref:putative porin n=1 Tax=Formosa sp. PL04 TaxID=3081755 RepID=UPI0029816367|nr:putative porin [Formosa sp. PL04]MDW5287231.1 putative porin [Formosa sp. PL04]
MYRSISRSFLLFLFCVISSYAQESETKSKLKFDGDFRFRIEQDWNSKKSDGSFRDDRSRLRYRVRLGITYEAQDWLTVGARIRTGIPNKQQDPHLTLGDGFKEFGGLPVAFEKAYAKFKYDWFSAWIGKNTYPFEKQNEEFWSDNVYPEGVFINGLFPFENKFLDSFGINLGHFIGISNGLSFSNDSYFEGLQFVATTLSKRLTVYSGIFYFNKMPNIPDGNGTFNINYTIINSGVKLEIIKKPKVVIGFEFHNNVQDLSKNDSISSRFKNQKNGGIAMITIGKLDKKKDFLLKLNYCYMERYAAVDYYAQNDWVRWDYSSQGSPDGRLTNFKGLEVMGGYAINEKINLKLRFFTVQQILSYGVGRENGNRIRLDFNVKL